MARTIRNGFRLAAGVVLTVAHKAEERIKALSAAMGKAADAAAQTADAAAAFYLVALESYAAGRAEAKGNDGDAHKVALEHFNGEVNSARDLIRLTLKGKDLAAFDSAGGTVEQGKTATREDRQKAAKSGKLTGNALAIHQRLESSYTQSSNARAILAAVSEYGEAIAPTVEAFLTEGKDGKREATGSDLYNAAMALRMSKGKSTDRGAVKAKGQTPASVLRRAVVDLVKLGRVDLARALVQVAAGKGIRGDYGAKVASEAKDDGKAHEADAAGVRSRSKSGKGAAKRSGK